MSMDGISRRRKAVSPASSSSPVDTKDETNNRGRKRFRTEEFSTEITESDSDMDEIISQPDNLLPLSQIDSDPDDSSSCDECYNFVDLDKIQAEPTTKSQCCEEEKFDGCTSNACHPNHEHLQATPIIIEPSYEAFSSIPFSVLTRRIEKVWERNQPGKQKLPTEDYLKALMPPEKLQQLVQSSNRPNSIYPLMRLLCPERDHRRFHTKENLLATAYVDAFGWNRDKPQAQALFHFRDPEAVRKAGIWTDYVAGDFSMVVYHVLIGYTSSKSGDRCAVGPQKDWKSKTKTVARVSAEPSNLSLGLVNESLDELAKISNPPSTSSHDWRNWRRVTTKKRKMPSQRQRRADWMKRFLNGGDRRLSPLEHRWLIRIILGDMRFGIGFEKLLSWYHVEGPALYTGYNSLKAVCKILAQRFMQERNRQNEITDADLKSEGRSKMTLSPSLQLENEPTRIQLGKPFTPMLSQRTGFDRLLNDVSERHRNFARKTDNEEYAKASLRSLAVRHPAFTIETKLDGERMLVHYFREGGLVKVHSRNGVWFSDVYSPVLGPMIRQAVGRHDCDIILDGELIAWDDSRKETIPFGYNRTVARLRRQWMKATGCFDWRDTKLHQGDSDCRVYGSDYFFGKQNDLLPDMSGKSCWLQFVAFDVVYVGGPNARKVVQSAVSPYLHESIDPANLVRMDLMERKKLLYRVVKHIPNCVEIVQTTVVRPNGMEVDGAEYFSHDKPMLEFGYPVSLLDSLTACFQGIISGIEDLDSRRRGHMSDEEISQRRASIVSQHYVKVVENLFLEGLLFKDLSSPYILGRGSQKYTFWRKYKPDYDCQAVASDLDLVVIGAYFGEGDRSNGNISGFLCACVDADDPESFYAVVNVDATALGREGRRQLEIKTSFRRPFGHSPMRLGKWFRPDGKHIPDFLSPCIDSGKTWNPTRKLRPDLWIDPRETGLVLVLNAGEITFSTDFPLGITLRFPRITRLRMDKKCDEIETSNGLGEILSHVQMQRAQSANAVRLSSGPSSAPDLRRFLTERQFKNTKSKEKSRQSPLPIAKAMLDISSNKTNIFRGLRFCVLDGTYALSVLDEYEAQAEEWKFVAKSIRSRRDLVAYIQENGGTVILSPDSACFVLGGHKNDFKVKIFIEAILSARILASKKKSKRAQKIKELSECKGVLHWTFPFRLGSGLGTCESSASITTKPLDYIARPCSTYREVCDVGMLHDTEMVELALGLIGSDSEAANMPEFITRNITEKAIFCAQGSAFSKPDALVFLHCPECYWKKAQIQSVAPLIQITGIPVSLKFTIEVTHIVVNNLGGLKTMEYKRETASAIRRKLGEEAGGLLDDLELFIVDSNDYSVLLVTPDWIRERFKTQKMS